jgi:glycosyltransferase involved in cell wall biosynthesis
VRPETTLAIVGRSPEPAVQALAGDPRIVVSGRVPDVRPWIWSSRISVVPLRFGGGIRIKIYEAMAAQSPLVSTSIGAEGLRVSPERDILLADTPAEFAGQTLRLLNDAALRESIGRAGQELVSHNYSWDKAAQDIDAALEECAKVRLAGAKP